MLAGILPRHDAPRDRNASPPVARRGFQFRLLPQGMSEFAPEPSVPWTASYDRVAAVVAVHKPVTRDHKTHNHKRERMRNTLQ